MDTHTYTHTYILPDTAGKLHTKANLSQVMDPDDIT